MKILNKLLFLAVCLTLLSSTAFARDSHHKSGLSLSYSTHHNDVQLGYSINSYHHQKKHHYSPRYSYRPNFNYGHHYKQPRYSNSSNQHHNYRYNSYSNHHGQKSCHPVTKIVVDHHGRYQSIGGTMCYDNHGQGYIALGSRHQRR